MPEFSLGELAKLADVTPRTIRFYIEQGLLPAPGSLGPKARYSDEHLERLRLIKKLQAAHLPLAEIRRQLGVMSPQEVASMSEPATPAPSQAIDYIRDVLRPASRPMPSMAPPAPAPTGPPPEPEATRSQWDRISLDPDVEIHVRRPLTRQNNKRVERLINIARQLFEED